MFLKRDEKTIELEDFVNSQNVLEALYRTFIKGNQMRVEHEAGVIGVIDFVTGQFVTGYSEYTEAQFNLPGEHTIYTLDKIGDLYGISLYGEFSLNYKYTENFISIKIEYGKYSKVLNFPITLNVKDIEKELNRVAQTVLG